MWFFGIPTLAHKIEDELHNNPTVEADIEAVENYFKNLAHYFMTKYGAADTKIALTTGTNVAETLLRLDLSAETKIGMVIGEIKTAGLDIAKQFDKSDINAMGEIGLATVKAGLLAAKQPKAPPVEPVPQQGEPEAIPLASEQPPTPPDWTTPPAENPPDSVPPAAV